MTTYRRICIRLSRRWDRIRAPWPIVGECHSSHMLGHLCSQCDGSHLHQWRSWPKAPRWVGGPGVPVRCTRCGGRKCDSDVCDLQRHSHTHAETTAP